MQKQSFAVILLGALALVFPYTGSAADWQSAPEHRSVTVQGFGSVSVIPDRATLELGVEARDLDLATARQEVVDGTIATLAVLDDLGIEKEHITSTAISIQPEYRWDDKTREQKLEGYRVQRGISVTVADLSLLGQVLEQAADAGVNRISPPQLGHSDADRLRREALAAAAVDARENAETLANALGAKIGNVRMITTLHAPEPRPMLARMAMAEADSGAVESYRSGSIDLSARVNVVFDLVTPDVEQL